MKSLEARLREQERLLAKLVEVIEGRVEVVAADEPEHFQVGTPATDSTKTLH